MRLRLLSLPALGLIISVMAHAANAADGQPVAVIFGQSVYSKDLVAPTGAGQAVDPANHQRTKGELLRARVWKAVFEDYARRQNITPTDAEIISQIGGH